MIGGTGAGSRFLKLGIRFLKKWSRPSAIDCARERLPERWAVAGGASSPCQKNKHMLFRSLLQVQDSSSLVAVAATVAGAGVDSTRS